MSDPNKIQCDCGASLCSYPNCQTFDVRPATCKCECGAGGVCEHKWDGKPYSDETSGLWTATCSNCGMHAIAHDLRYAP